MRMAAKPEARPLSAARFLPDGLFVACAYLTLWLETGSALAARLLFTGLAMLNFAASPSYHMSSSSSDAFIAWRSSHLIFLGLICAQSVLSHIISRRSKQSAKLIGGGNGPRAMMTMIGSGRRSDVGLGFHVRRRPSQPFPHVQYFIDV